MLPLGSIANGWEYEDERVYYAGEEARARDTKIDEAKQALIERLFSAKPDRVFYGRQVEVLFEREFFHWITARALGELAADGVIKSKKETLREGLAVRLYWAPKNRYWRRQANGIKKLILEYSKDGFGRALGRQGEMLFDAALPSGGFMPKGKNVRSYGDKEWAETDHDLDRVFERDGIAYGTEIKNTLDYIDREELEIKLQMCEELELRPLFIMRWAPKSYMELIIGEGGFALLFEWQLYPFGYEGLASRVRETLGLKVDCPKAISEGTVQRFLRWHLKQLGEEGT